MAPSAGAARSLGQRGPPEERAALAKGAFDASCIGQAADRLPPIDLTSASHKLNIEMHHLCIQRGTLPGIALEAARTGGENKFSPRVLDGSGHLSIPSHYQGSLSRLLLTKGMIEDRIEKMAMDIHKFYGDEELKLSCCRDDEVIPTTGEF